jgi:dTDP-4-dehydrorhamnose reductase
MNSTKGEIRRILVIGAKGMLGRDLLKALSSSFHADKQSDWEILGWDLGEIDIREEKGTVTKIANFRPEIVINLAAYTDVDGCESNEGDAFAVNAEGMKHVALGALKCHAKVVYLSTDYIFDGKKKEPYLEEDPPHPLSVYGRSKWKGEQYARELVEDVLIVRTQWLYGRYGKNFVTSILRQAGEKKVLSIVNDQIGSPTYTVDLSEAISVLLRYNARGVFHVTNSDLCTWYTFGQGILKLSGMERVKVIPISSKDLGRPAIRPSYSVLNCQKLKQVTGMVLRPWSQALKEFLLSIR